jgi:ABC-type lipoprotein release transport system permease subunit
MKGAAFRNILDMAWRNLARHRVKTVITATAVAVSVTLYIFMDAWLLGMNLESRRNIVAYETGAAKIQTEAYFAKKDDLPMYEGFAGWEPLSRLLEAAGYAAAPRFVFAGTLYSRSGSAPVVFNGIDPAAEERVLRYPRYLEAGRFPRPGTFEIALGTLTAEKLRVGIPLRPTVEEFEEDLVASARNDAEAAFIRGLYEPAPQRKKEPSLFEIHETPAEAARKRFVLKEGISRSGLDRLWDILAASGRMNTRISTVIDMKALPESIGKLKFERDLLPSLAPESRDLVRSAYIEDTVLDAYRLTAEDENLRRKVLDAMTAVDYSGAIRHVNQLIEVRVSGVVNSPNPKNNGASAYIPLDVLQDEAGLLLEGQVTEIIVRKAGADDSRLPGPGESPAAIKEALVSRGTSLPEGVSIYRWSDYVKDYLAVSAQDDITSRIMIILLFLLSFLGITNTMLMAILERTKETGMLRALGMTDGQLVLTYILEAGMIGAVGSVIGMTLGTLINIPMVAYGIDYSGMAKEMGGDFGYRITAVFRSAWNPAVIAGSGIAATLLSALVAIPPTLRALKMPVTESLRFE